MSNGIVQIEILNHGLNDVSNFNVSYSVDGASAVSESISSNLLSGSSMNYIFSTPFSVLPGQYEVCSWTDYTSDMQHNNDTSCVNTTIVGVNDFDMNETERILLKITDLLGRETKQTNQPLFFIYDDGTVEKRIVIE